MPRDSPAPATGRKGQRPHGAHSSRNLSPRRVMGVKTDFTRRGSFVVTWEGQFRPASDYHPELRDILVVGGGSK